MSSNIHAIAGTELSGGPSQRKLRNLLIDRRFQLPWVLGVAALTFAIFVTLGTIIVRQDQTASAAVLNGLNALYDPDQATMLSGLFEQSDRTVLWTLVTIALVLIGSLAGSILVLTHRVAGPMVALRHGLSNLREGSLKRARPFRRGDAFREVSDELVATVAALRAREQHELETLILAKSNPEDAQHHLSALIAAKRARLEG